MVVCRVIKNSSFPRKEEFTDSLQLNSSFRKTLQDLAPLPQRPVAGFHRASPSTTLNENHLFNYMYHITVKECLSINYNKISTLCKETGEPVYLTKNGEGDLVVMGIGAFSRRETMLRLRGTGKQRYLEPARTAVML